jgi:hypothetical protein
MKNTLLNGAAQPDGQKPASRPVLPVVTLAQQSSASSRSAVSTAIHRAHRRRQVLREQEAQRALRTAISVTGWVLLLFAFLLAGATIHNEMRLQQQDAQIHS